MSASSAQNQVIEAHHYVALCDALDPLDWIKERVASVWGDRAVCAVELPNDDGTVGVSVLAFGPDRAADLAGALSVVTVVSAGSPQ